MGKKLVDRDNLLEHLVEKQFTYIEKTTIAALFNPKWREEWSIPKEKHNEWKKYCKFVMKKVLKFSDRKSRETFDWLNENWGLIVK